MFQHWHFFLGQKLFKLKCCVRGCIVIVQNPCVHSAINVPKLKSSMPNRMYCKSNFIMTNSFGIKKVYQHSLDFYAFLVMSLRYCIFYWRLQSVISRSYWTQVIVSSRSSGTSSNLAESLNKFIFSFMFTTLNFQYILGTDFHHIQIFDHNQSHISSFVVHFLCYLSNS
jgi:hypothetical protein